MKKFILGLICGAIICGSMAFAATYVAESPTFKVLVNGNEFHSDPPVLVVEGRTYLPLRAMGDVLGVPVEWNAELSQVEVGTTSSENSQYTFGSTFNFDGLQITIGTELEWTTVDNQFSDLNGSKVAKVPVIIKNISQETHGLNMFYFDMYSPRGSSLQSVSAYFDDSVDFAGDIRPGGVQNAYFYLLYDGDGDYYIEFDNYTSKVEVKLPIAQ